MQWAKDAVIKGTRHAAYRGKEHLQKYARLFPVRSSWKKENGFNERESERDSNMRCCNNISLQHSDWGPFSRVQENEVHLTRGA
jgi:hypothetical protein